VIQINIDLRVSRQTLTTTIVMYSVCSTTRGEIEMLKRDMGDVFSPIELLQIKRERKQSKTHTGDGCSRETPG
jgi:hypothetical protein